MGSSASIFAMLTRNGEHCPGIYAAT